MEIDNKLSINCICYKLVVIDFQQSSVEFHDHGFLNLDKLKLHFLKLLYELKNLKWISFQYSILGGIRNSNLMDNFNFVFLTLENFGLPNVTLLALA